MGVKISVNLEESSIEFLDKATKNRSAYINSLIREKQKEAFESKLEADYREQSKDLKWQAEVELWDCVAGDGLGELVDGMTKVENDCSNRAEIEIYS